MYSPFFRSDVQSFTDEELEEARRIIDAEFEKRAEKKRANPQFKYKVDDKIIEISTSRPGKVIDRRIQDGYPEYKVRARVPNSYGYVIWLAERSIKDGHEETSDDL